MKKLYIQPAVEVETIETLDIIASTNVEVRSYIDESDPQNSTYDVNTHLSGGHGNYGAKGNSLWGFEDDEEFD